MYASFRNICSLPLKDFHHSDTGSLGDDGDAAEQGIKIGSTTGYTAKMMEIVRPEPRPKDIG